jgi:hypothetical protein
VRLQVGVLGAEQRLGHVRAVRLDGVDVVAARVEAVARVALGVLVVEQVAHRLLDGQRRVVLAGDQLDVGPLINQLLHHPFRDQRVDAAHPVDRRVEADARRIGPSTAQPPYVALHRELGLLHCHERFLLDRANPGEFPTAAGQDVEQRVPAGGRVPSTR